MTEKKITQAELDKKAQQLLEEKESEARMRTYQGPLAKIIIFLLNKYNVIIIYLAICPNVTSFHSLLAFLYLCR